jgi:hypothetical protein
MTGVPASTDWFYLPAAYFSCIILFKELIGDEERSSYTCLLKEKPGFLKIRFL